MTETKVAVVTGTSRGLGAATAQRLLDDGYRVVGVSRSGSPDLDSAAFIDLRADLSNLDEAASIVEKVIQRERRLDVVVNNAATIQHGDAWQLKPTDLRQLLTVNLSAPWVLSQAAVQHWLRTDSPGIIVNICSIESDIAWVDPPQAGYAVTKGGLLGLTRALALDLAETGIRTNGVAPGAIRTELAPSDESNHVTRIPLGRLGRPCEIAGVVAFLCGPDSSYVNGEVIYADGGYRLP